MRVVFLSPSYPPEMQQFTRGLAELGAEVLGVGDAPPAEAIRPYLSDWLRVPGLLDTDDVFERVRRWASGRRVDRIETNWEPLVHVAARLREALDVPGMSADVVMGFRDKPLMRERVAAAGLRVPRTIRVRTRREVWEAAEALGYPLLLKPVAGAGSADTWRVDDPTELDRVLDRLGHVPEASCEEFVVGDELTYETLCIDGEPVYESVSTYEPSALVARQNEWISPIILSERDLDRPDVRIGVELGRAALRALGMGTGFTHMEWFRVDGEAVFGEVACRSPGANMVDLMNYAGDVDLYREWARVACWHAFEASTARPWHAAIVFKRARGRGRIRAVRGLDAFLARHAPHVARVDLLPVGAQRRDWRQTFLSDGNLVVRHPDRDTTLALAREVARDVHLEAG